VQVGTLLLILGGLAVLVVGGEVLVRGAGGLARAMGMSSLVVGLTVVAFATSAPELAVTVDAVLAGTPGLAVGNVVGSNIANVLLVLGLAALLLPLAVRSQLVRADIPVMVALSVVTLLLALDGGFSRMDGPSCSSRSSPISSSPSLSADVGPGRMPAPVRSGSGTRTTASAAASGVCWSTSS
jgi:cation:H+ antiporter